MTSPRPTVEFIGVSAASRQSVTCFSLPLQHGAGVSAGWSTLVTVGRGANVDHPALAPGQKTPLVTASADDSYFYAVMKRPK